MVGEIIYVTPFALVIVNASGYLALQWMSILLARFTTTCVQSYLVVTTAVCDSWVPLEARVITGPIKADSPFPITGLNIPTISTCEVEANTYSVEDGEQNATNSVLGFNSGCTDVKEADDVTSGASSHITSFTFHACNSHCSQGGIVTMVLVVSVGDGLMSVP